MRSAVILAALLAAATVSAETVTSERTTPPGPNQMVQCLMRNDDASPVYVLPSWIECTNEGTVTTRQGAELQPGESLNLTSTDPRACRCQVVADGKVTLQLFTSTGWPADDPRRLLRRRLGNPGSQP